MYSRNCFWYKNNYYIFRFRCVIDFLFLNKLDLNHNFQHHNFLSYILIFLNNVVLSDYLDYIDKKRRVSKKLIFRFKVVACNSGSIFIKIILKFKFLSLKIISLLFISLIIPTKIFIKIFIILFD